MATSSDPRQAPSEPAREERPSLTTGTYVRSLGALILLTLISYWLSYEHLGAFGMPVALGIAAIKVSIVALFFMGLVNEPASHRVTGIIAVLFVVLLSSLAAADVLTRF